MSEFKLANILDKAGIAKYSAPGSRNLFDSGSWESNTYVW